MSNSGRSSPAPPGAARLHTKAQATPLRQALGCGEGGRQIVVSWRARAGLETGTSAAAADPARARPLSSETPTR
jgi:hypothetical protein